MMKIRFAGHETFACRATWLHKGLNLISQEDKDLSAFSKTESVIELGVGKNMVLSIRYWLLAFGLIDDKGELTKEARLLVEQNDNNPIDPSLENKDSLWLLHTSLVNNQFATLYSFFFCDFFKRKASRTFTEREVINGIQSWLKNLDLKPPSERSLKNDFKVLVDNYCPKLNSKDSEESMMNLMVDLNLIQKTNYKSDGESVYELNKIASNSISNNLFAALLIKNFKNKSESLDNLYDRIGYPLILDREQFINRIENVCFEYPEYFVYKEDAGLKELQLNKEQHYLDFLTNTQLDKAC